MTNTRRERVFVYGSLRRGQMYHRLVAQVRELGTHITEPIFTMLDLGPYPGVLTGGDTAIVGEVLALDKQTLLRIDALEDCPHSYQRISIDTRFGSAWMYIYAQARGNEPIVVSGDWLHRQRS